MKAIILAGGLGTRLRSISGETPKCMMPVMGRPMVDLIIKNLRKQKITDITLALHYKSEEFVNYFRGTVKYKIESEPMGTGGAIKNCVNGDEPVLVMNGDTIVNIDYADMLAHHSREVTVAVNKQKISAGVYIINPSIFERFPMKAFSFEKDVMPHVTFSHYNVEWFHDLGTVDGYKNVPKDWV